MDYSSGRPYIWLIVTSVTMYVLVIEIFSEFEMMWLIYLFQ